MKHSKRIVRAVSLAVAATLGLGMFTFLSGCGGKKDALTIMTQDLNGLYNPFFSTAGTDMDVVGQTQISMFSTDEGGQIAYGDDEPVVVKDFMKKAAGKETEYYFVLKNNIKFSDGKPLTMNDVLFNMYVYLDPAYTGSTTMYSTDIVGLQKYRQQQNVSGDSSTQDTELNTTATNMAIFRRTELINAYNEKNTQKNGGVPSDNKDVTEDEMLDYLATRKPSSGYKGAIAVNGSISDDEAREQLVADYKETLRLFHEELERDFASAADAYQSAPYTNVDSDGDGKVEMTNESDIDFSSPVVSFMYMEGYIDLAYYRDAATNEEDFNHIVGENTQGEKSEKKYRAEVIELKDAAAARNAAIEYVYDSKVASELHYILQYWATGGTLLTNYTGKAKDIILHQIVGDGELAYPNIEGITSLGHSSTEESITITHEDGTTVDYKIAHNHNDDGTPVSPDTEYDVLKIRINGTDPKAIWNFGFTVAPHHYYSDPEKYPVDIEKNEFGVEWGSFDFMQNVIQGVSSKEFGSVRKNMIPVGAGPYVATNRGNGDNPKDTEFYTDGIVYYKANENFLLGKPKTGKMRYVVVSSSNAIDRLKSDVDFVEPQYTISNYKTLQSLEKSGYKYVSSWQLGYGYIGVNAGKVPNINLRKAIMSAMNTKLSLQYYVGGQATNICYPMSLVSWAYPRTEGKNFNPQDPLENMVVNNGQDYMTFTNDTDAKAKIQKYMKAANVSQGSSQLKMKFTIAGANTDHPCYAVFFHAAELLNSCGWDVTVEPDLNALTKLATGSLTVWAAAWGSTIDPDMYQVYHKNSTATSVYAWGYREILGQPDQYREENTILNTLATLIDDARETDNQTTRTNLYKQAMDQVLRLAVELPVYQRKTLYAFNAKTIKVDSLTVTEDATGQLLGNSYQSPLSRIWEVEFA